MPKNLTGTAPLRGGSEPVGMKGSWSSSTYTHLGLKRADDNMTQGAMVLSCSNLCCWAITGAAQQYTAAMLDSVQHTAAAADSTRTHVHMHTPGQATRGTEPAWPTQQSPPSSWP